MGKTGTSPWLKWLQSDLATYPPLVLNLRISGSIFPLPLFASMAHPGKTLWSLLWIPASFSEFRNTKKFLALLGIDPVFLSRPTY